MTTIQIHRPTIRKGHYRARFASAPNLTLLVPIQWCGHFTFAQLAAWPEDGKWKELSYVPAPARACWEGDVVKTEPVKLTLEESGLLCHMVLSNIQGLHGIGPLGIRLEAVKNRMELLYGKLAAANDKLMGKT